MTSAPTLTEPAASPTDNGTSDVTTVAPQAVPAQHGLAAHSHVGGRTTGKPASHLHGIGSADPADHPVPSGKEENWRFTPLHRLRHLHEDETPGDGSVSVHVDAAPEVEVETVGRGDDRLGRAGTPADRVAARAWSSFEKATVLTVPRDVVASAPTVVTVRGDAADGAAFGHLLVDVQQHAHP